MESPAEALKKMANATPEMYEIDQQLSVYLPHVFPEQASCDYISAIFHSLGIADVKHVEFQRIVGGYQAYVFMNKWYNNFSVDYIQHQIIDEDKEARLVHDDPYYWILLPNTGHYSVTRKNDLADITEKMNTLETKNQDLEVRLGEAQWWINLHETHIKHLSDKNEAMPSSSSHIGCGAISDAWEPSQSSQIYKSKNIWKRRLRPRTENHVTYN